MGRRRRFNPGASIFRRFVQRHCNDGEAKVFQLFGNFQPPGQAIKTASPGGVGRQQDLLVPMPEQRVQMSIEVGQSEILGFQRLQGLRARGRHDRRVLSRVRWQPRRRQAEYQFRYSQLTPGHWPIRLPAHNCPAL